MLESDLDRKKRSFAESEDRISELEREYEGYKVRAASVLRKAKEEDANREKRGADGKSQELMAIERVVESMNQKIVDMR